MIFRLGIGDILITKMVFDEHQINKKFKIYLPFIESYREGSEEYLKFIEKLIVKLFGENSYQLTEKNAEIFDNSKYNIKSCDLSKYFDLKDHFDEPYVLFHTKVRLDNCAASFFENKKTLKTFFENLKTNLKIILIGERELEENVETKIHNHFTIYEELKSLNKHNNVLDLTEKSLNNRPNWDIFIRDLSIINRAKLNVGIGYGGNMVISSAFSSKNCFYISNLRHPFFNYIPESTYTDFEKFLDKVEQEIVNG